MVLFYVLVHYKHYRCWECNPALLPVTTGNKFFTCSDQPGWHFLLLFTNWIIFLPQNICSHMLPFKKCPLCQVLLLNDPELEGSQPLRGLEGSTSAAAQLRGEFLEQRSLQTLAFQPTPASIAPAEDNTAGCYNSCPLHQINISQNDIRQYSELLSQSTEVPLYQDICISTINTAVSASWFLRLGEGECLQNPLSLAYHYHQHITIRCFSVMKGILV